jgi:RimJ/RimL family protein N-acetyltransferase
LDTHADSSDESRNRLGPASDIAGLAAAWHWSRAHNFVEHLAVMAVEVPTIETKRLVLRGWSECDLEPLRAFYADDPASAFVGGPRQRNETVLWLMARLGQWYLRGYGSFVITERGRDEFLGWCGANHYFGSSEPTLQWALIARARGKGYMAEAGHPTLDFLFKVIGRQTLLTTIHPANVSSQATARRLGGAPTGSIVVDDGHDVEAWQFQRIGA